MCAAALLYCSACSPSHAEDPDLQILGHASGTTLERSDLPTGTEISYGSIIVCLDRPGEIEVTDVAPLDPKNIRVDEYGLRPSPYWRHKPGLGDAVGDLRSVHFSSGHTTTYVCNPKTGRASELGVVVQSEASGPASLSGFKITYRSGDRQGTLDYPLGIVLCTGKQDPNAATIRCT